MAVRGVPVPQENSLQLAPQATPPVLCHQQRGARRLCEVAAGPVGGSYRVGAESQGLWQCLDPPSISPVVLRTLTNVGGTFSHHVLIVVDSGIWDSGLGLIRRDHKEFLRGREKWGGHEMEGGDGGAPEYWVESGTGLGASRGTLGARTKPGRVGVSKHWLKRRTQPPHCNPFSLEWPLSINVPSHRWSSSTPPAETGACSSHPLPWP